MNDIIRLQRTFGARTVEVRPGGNTTRERASSGVVPIGQHTVRVASATTGTSRAGNPKVVLTFEDSDGRRITKHVPVSGKGQRIAEQVFRALGVDPTGEIRLQDLIGRAAVIDVAEGPYGLQVEQVIPVATPPLDTARDDEPF